MVDIQLCIRIQTFIVEMRKKKKTGSFGSVRFGSFGSLSDNKQSFEIPENKKMVTNIFEIDELNHVN